MIGRTRGRQGSPPVPNEAVVNVRSDIETVSEAVRDRGQR